MKKEKFFKEIITIQEGDVDAFFELNYDQQLMKYFHEKIIPSNVILKYENTEKYVVLNRIGTDIVFSGKHFFRKRHESKFIFNKERKRFFNTLDRFTIVQLLCEIPQFNWLKKDRDERRICNKVFSDSITRDVLLGKLTNSEDIVKKYLKTLHLKGIDWKTFVRFSQENTTPVLWLHNFTTNCNAAMELLLANSTKTKIFYDMLQQAMALNEVINPRWSEKRMTEEHTRMTRQLMKKEIALKSNEGIYQSPPSFSGYPCKVLDTEQAVFEEGLDMHHCIYTNYWHKILDYKYIGISFSAPERFTLGLKWTNDGWSYDQAYKKYDNELGDESREMVSRFLSDKNVVSAIYNIKRPDSETYRKKMEDMDKELVINNINGGTRIYEDYGRENLPL